MHSHNSFNIEDEPFYGRGHGYIRRLDDHCEEETQS